VVAVLADQVAGGWVGGGVVDGDVEGVGGVGFVPVTAVFEEDGDDIVAVADPVGGPLPDESGG